MNSTPCCLGLRCTSSAASPPTIPPTALRLIHDLQEIVCNTDDEIYAMLRECNMDPNETVQRLLIQDTFHEVKRKKDRKKENTANKEIAHTRTRSSSMLDVKVSDRVNCWMSYKSCSNTVESIGGRRMQSSRRWANGQCQRVNMSSMYSKSLSQVEIKVSTGSSTKDTTNGCASDLLAVSNSHPKAEKAVGTNCSISDDDVAKLQKAHKNGSDSSFCMERNSVLELTSSSRSSFGLNLRSSDSIVEQATMDLVNNQSKETKSSVISSEFISHYKSTGESHLPPHAKSVDERASCMPTASISENSLSVAIQAHGTSSSFPEVLSTLANDSHDVKLKLMGSREGGHRLESSLPVKVQISELHTMEPSSDVRTISNISSKAQEHNIQEEKSVIIPQHLQVPETMQNQLSFGSFREEIPALLSVSSAIELEKPAHNKDESQSQELIAESATASSPCHTTTVSHDGHTTASHDGHSTTAPVEPPVDNKDASINRLESTFTPVLSQSSDSQQLMQLSYSNGMNSYIGFGVIPPRMTSKVNDREVVECQHQDLSQISHFVSHTDARVNFYSPVMQPMVGNAAHYNQFISTNVATKFNAGSALLIAQENSSQEMVGVPLSNDSTVKTDHTSTQFRSDVSVKLTPPVSVGRNLSMIQEAGHSAVAQATQVVGLPRSGHAMLQTGNTILQIGSLIPQQPMPVHAYPLQHTAIPLAPIGLNIVGVQYLAPGYGYMPTPLQHNFALNTGYLQSHTPSNYVSLGSNPYFLSGIPIKYASPQYKIGAVACPPNLAATPGYCSYVAQSGFTNGSATAIAPGYGNVADAQFKQNNMYMPGLQRDGSTIWFQVPSSRDMALNLNNSYTVHGPAQLAAYAHAQLSPSTAATYSSIYHPSQVAQSHPMTE